MKAEKKAALDRRLMLVVLYTANRDSGDNTPATTIKALADTLGMDAAAQTIAETVKTVGTWDGRISRSNREWADSVPNAESKENLDRYGLYTPSEIHPAHINQLADAMRAYQRNQ